MHDRSDRLGIDSPRLRQVTADYYNCLKRLDEGIGLLLAELRESGKADDTLIIYIGDHGAQFPRGKVSLYEGGLRIPLILHWPGRVKPGMVRDELVSTVDIPPTFLQAAGLDVPARLPGLPLQKLLDEKQAEWRQYVYGFNTGSFPLAFTLRWSIRDDRYKLIVNLMPGQENLGSRCYLDPDYRVTVVSGFTPAEQAAASPQVSAALARFKNPPRYELFDLKNDPHEWTNLALPRILPQMAGRAKSGRWGCVRALRGGLKARPLRVRLRPEQMTTVAAEHGYRDGSSTDRVIKRLEEKANSDRAQLCRLRPWTYLQHLEIASLVPTTTYGDGIRAWHQDRGFGVMWGWHDHEASIC